MQNGGMTHQNGSADHVNADPLNADPLQAPPSNGHAARIAAARQASRPEGGLRESYTPGSQQASVLPLVLGAAVFAGLGALAARAVHGRRGDVIAAKR